MTKTTEIIQIDILTILAQLGMNKDIIRKIQQDQAFNRQKGG